MPKHEPEVVNLRRYKEQALKRAKTGAPPKPPKPKGGPEPLLGARPGAGLILLAVALVAIVLWLAPRFF